MLAIDIIPFLEGEKRSVEEDISRLSLVNPGDRRASRADDRDGLFVQLAFGVVRQAAFLYEAVQGLKERIVELFSLLLAFAFLCN